MPKRKQSAPTYDAVNETSPLRTTPSITTSSMIAPQPSMILAAPASVSSQNLASQPANQWANAKACLSGGPPVTPSYLEIGDPRSDSSLALACGLYILAAPTGAGKTVLSMALAAWANDSGIPATYVSCFEPRCPKIATMARQLMVEPNLFWDDVRAMMSTSTVPKLVIFDSATLPLKTYASLKAYNNQATFTGGLQPSDRGFLERGYDESRRSNACLIININSISIPYVQQLAAATEGLINITNVASFTYADRSPASKRELRPVVIPTPFVNSALDYFGYGEYNRNSALGWARGFTGVETQPN